MNSPDAHDRLAQSKADEVRAAPLVTVTDASALRAGYLVAAPVSSENTGAPGLTGTPSFATMLQALRRRWLMGLGLALLAAAGIVVGVLILFPAKYVAQVRIHVPSRGEAPVFGGGNPEETEFAVYKANMASMVKSPWVASAALKQKTPQGRAISDLSIVRNRGSEAADWIELNLKTDFLLGPEILKVTLAADKADEVAALLNAIAKAFVEENEQRETARRQQRLEQLGAKHRELEAELAELRKLLGKLEKDNKVEDKDARVARYAAILAKLNQYEQAMIKNTLDQIAAGEEIRVLKTRLTNINELPISGERLEEALKLSTEAQGVYKRLEEVELTMQQIRLNAQPEAVNDLLAKEVRKKDDLRKRLLELRDQLRPELEKRARLKSADEMSDRLLKLTDSFNSLSKQEQTLQAEYRKVQAEVARMAPNSQPESPTLVTMRDKVNGKQAALDQVAKTINLMRAEVQNPRISLVQAAVEPSGKDTARQTKMAGAGAVGMFVVVLFGVAFLEYRSGKINAADEVAQGLGLSVVGTLPAEPRRRVGGADNASPREITWQNQLHEAIDGIRTMLLHTARSENLRVIMVSSAAGGEGKTTLASQLASSLARAWRRTLLIDGDLRSPAAHDIFGLSQAPGFSELLRGEVKANDAVKQTALGQLSLLPAGHADDRAIQALAQDNVRGLIEDLKQRFDFIIIDSAPLLPVADSLLLGQHVDGVLLSVLRDVSRAPAVQAAQQRLHNLGIRTLGAVVIGTACEPGQLGYQYSGKSQA